jgi:hypothetical protein
VHQPPRKLLFPQPVLRERRVEIPTKVCRLKGKNGNIDIAIGRFAGKWELGILRSHAA